MTVVTFTVKDANTQAPIAGAYCMLACTFSGGGTVPFDGYSDSNGVVSIDIDGFAPVVAWSVTASGYEPASGSGQPPATVLLTSTTPPPPPPVENLAVIILPALVGAGTVAIGILLR
jgi:hypothetical protein